MFTPHTPIHRDHMVFNVVPHLAGAREMANLYGERVAVYRYVDQWPDDVFVRPLADVADARKRDGRDRLVIEAVVSPRRSPAKPLDNLRETC